MDRYSVPFRALGKTFVARFDGKAVRDAQQFANDQAEAMGGGGFAFGAFLQAFAGVVTLNGQKIDDNIAGEITDDIGWMEAGKIYAEAQRRAFPTEVESGRNVRRIAKRKGG